MIGCRHIDMARRDLLSVHGRNRGQRTRLVEKLRQDAASGGGQMLGDEDRRRKVNGQCGAQALQGLHTAGRRANYDDVLGRQGLLLRVDNDANDPEGARRDLV